MINLYQTSFILFLLYCLINQADTLYFDVGKHYESCIHNEFFHDTIVIIQYDTLNIPDNIKEEANGFYKIQIKSDDNSKIFDKQIMKSLKDKALFIVPESNVYNICISALSSQKSLYDENNNIKVSLTLSTSDPTPNPPYEKYPDNDSLKLLDEIIKALHQSTDNIIKNNEFMMQNEETFSHFQEENGRLLILIALSQLILVIAIVVYSLCSLRSQLNKILN